MTKTKGGSGDENALNSNLGLFALCNYFWFIHVIQWATLGEMGGDRFMGLEVGVP